MSEEPPPSANVLQNTLEAYFAAIAARTSALPRSSPKTARSRIQSAALSAMGGTEWRGLFSVGVAAPASHVEITVLAALPSGGSIAAHWAMTARGKAGARSKPRH